MIEDAIGHRPRLGRRVLLAAPFAMPFGARAESWPKKPVRVILPGPAGGLIDLAGRAVGDVMHRELGQPWLIDPRPGANGIVGAQAFLAAPADGHTLYLTVTGHVVLPFVTKVPFDVMADFKPVAMIGNSTSLVCVPAASPADTIAGFVAHAKASSGKLNYLNAGNGTITHLLPELLKIRFAVDLTSIYYKGLPPGVVDLLSGRLDIGVVSTALAIRHVQAGRLKALAIVGSQRLVELPDVATLAEQGVADLTLRSWLPLYGQKGMPDSIVGQLNAAMSVALADSSTSNRLDSAYIESTPMTPTEVGGAMRTEHERLGRLVQRLGIKADGEPR